MKRALLIIIGIILLLVGLAATIGGAAVLIFVGPAGVYSADAGRITGTGNALLFNEFKVNTGNYTSTVEKFVELTVGASGANGQQVFIGVGPSAAVNHYLAGVQRDVVSDINGSSAKVTSIPGTTKPTPPNNQTFWTDKAVGDSPSIKVDAMPGTTLVIMNANTTAPVSVNLLIGGKSSSLFPGAIVSVVIGVLLIVLAIWLFIAAKRSRRKAQIQAEAYTPPTLQPPLVPQPVITPSPTQPAPQSAPVPVPEPSAPPFAPPTPPQQSAPAPAPRPSAGGDGPPEPPVGR